MAKIKYKGRLAERPEDQWENILQRLAAGIYRDPAEDYPELVLELMNHFDVEHAGNTLSVPALFKLVVEMAKAYEIPAFTPSKTGRPEAEEGKLVLIGLAGELVDSGEADSVREACKIIYERSLFDGITERTDPENLRIRYQRNLNELKEKYSVFHKNMSEDELEAFVKMVASLRL